MKKLICISALLLAAPAARGAQLAQADFKELLSYDLEELVNVKVVSASKELEPARLAPATVRVITAEQIAERGYQTLEEALSGLPGFQFRDIAGFNSYVFMRGLPSQNNLILLLVDGVQINELNSGGFYGGAQYNLANVKRIEVVYGPASALYGTNAVSGIVNLITKDPADICGGAAGFTAGGFGTRGADFSYGFRDEAAGYGASFSGAMKHTDKHRLGGASGGGNWSEAMENFEDDWAFDGKLQYKDLSFGVVAQDKQASRSTNYRTTGTPYLDHGTNWHIRFVNSWLAHALKREAWELNSKLYYRMSTVMDDTVDSVYDLACATCGQQGRYRPNDMYGLESRFSVRPSGNTELTAGFVAEHENLARDYSYTYSGDPAALPAAPGRPTMDFSELLSLYAQAYCDLAPGLRLTGGLRHDSSSSYGESDTPRAGLVYTGKKLSLKLLYAEAFRAPKPWDYSYGVGNGALDPEKLRSLELAGVYAIGEHLAADLSLYQNRLEGLLVKNGANTQYVNSGDIKTRGLEAQLEFAGGPFKGRVHYALQDSEDETGASTAEISRHTAGAGAFYAFGSQVKLDLEGRWLGRRRNPGGGRVRDAFVTDATLSFLNARNLTARLICKNVFGEVYYHTSNTSGIESYRQPGRQLLLQVGYAFGL